VNERVVRLVQNRLYDLNINVHIRARIPEVEGGHFQVGQSLQVASAHGIQDGSRQDFHNRLEQEADGRASLMEVAVGHSVGRAQVAVGCR
jgi:seryl-tRNA(Sec) selenium transferase